MATAKRKTASKSKPANNGTLPSGYKVIGRAPSWDVEKNPVVAGIRGEVRTVTMDKGTSKERDVRTCIVEDATLGPVTVWESGMLKDFFDQTSEGDDVRIEYIGLGKAKKGQNAPKLFTVGVR